VLLHVYCAPQTIADMIVYNKSRREARNRLVARSWERPYLKFKVGAVPLLRLEVHILIGQHCCPRPPSAAADQQERTYCHCYCTVTWFTYIVLSQCCPLQGPSNSTMCMLLPRHLCR
jgi:hypothetical protein